MLFFELALPVHQAKAVEFNRVTIGLTALSVAGIFWGQLNEHLNEVLMCLVPMIALHAWVEFGAVLFDNRIQPHQVIPPQDLLPPVRIVHHEHQYQYANRRLRDMARLPYSY